MPTVTPGQYVAASGSIVFELNNHEDVPVPDMAHGTTLAFTQDYLRYSPQITHEIGEYPFELFWIAPAKTWKQSKL